MDQRKQRNSILKVPNSVRPERDGVDIGGDTEELGGGNVNSGRGRCVSFSDTTQVKEFANSTGSSNEDSFSGSNFNQTMVGEDIDMDISDISGEGDDDEQPIVPNPEARAISDGQEQEARYRKILETRRSFRSIEGFGSVNEENDSPNMGAGGGVFKEGGGQRTSPMTLLNLKRVNAKMSVVDKASLAIPNDYTKTIFSGSRDMSVSSIVELDILPRKCRRNRMTISTPHNMSLIDTPQNTDRRQGLEEKNPPKEAKLRSTNSKATVSSATASLYSAKNHTIFAEPVDMSVSSIDLDQPAMLPSAPKKCRKNRMTISTSQNMSVAEPSSSFNRTRMAGSNADTPIVEAPASTVHSLSSHTLFTGPGEMSIDEVNGTFKNSSKSRIPRKVRGTMSTLKELTRVDNADMLITEPIVSTRTRHLKFTKVTESVDTPVSTLVAPPAPLPVAELSHNGRKNVNSAPSYNKKQSDPLSLLEETSGGHPRSNSTMLTGPGDMSMYVIDKNAATRATPVIDKTQRKNRMTICNPGDMSIMEQSQNIGKLPKNNGVTLPSSVKEIPVVEPAVSAQGYQDHEGINGSDISNPAPSHQEQIYPKITIRKSGEGVTQPQQQLYLRKPAPNPVRDPLGKSKIDKKLGDQAHPVQFSFGKFGLLKTPKRNKIIPERGPSATSKLRLKQNAQTPAMLPRNKKYTKDVGLDCTIENQEDAMKSVIGVSIMTSPTNFPIGKPVAKTVDMGTSPIVILESENLSTSRSFIFSKLVEMTVTESSTEPTITAAHRQERDPTEPVAVDMSVSAVEVEPSPTPTAVQNTHRRNRMTLASSKNMDVSLVQNNIPPLNTAESVEENNDEISFHPTKLTKKGKLSQPEQVSSTPSDYPNTGPEISTELVETSMLSSNDAEPSAAHQSQKGGENGLSTSTSKLTSAIFPPEEDGADANNRIDQGPYLIGTGHPLSSKTRIASVKGKDSTTPSPTHANDDAEILVQKSGSHHPEMVSMNMSSFSYQSQVYQQSDTETSSSDEDDMEQEDIQKESVSNLEEEAKTSEICMKANAETDAEAILEAVQNNSIDDVPHSYSISFLAETFQEDNQEDIAERESEMIRTANLDRTEFGEHSFGKLSNGTMETQAGSSFTLPAVLTVSEPSLSFGESSAKVSTVAIEAPPPTHRKTSEFPARPPKSPPFSSAYKAVKEKLLNAPDDSDIFQSMNFKFSLTNELCALSDPEWADIARSFSEFLGPDYTESVTIHRNTRALHNSSGQPQPSG